MKIIQKDAEQAIRFIQINSYEELFNTLSTNLKYNTSIDICKYNLYTIYQNNTTVDNYNNRFLKCFRELRYATQAMHSASEYQKIALNILEKEAIGKYISNLD